MLITERTAERHQVQLLPEHSTSAHSRGCQEYRGGEGSILLSSRAETHATLSWFVSITRLGDDPAEIFATPEPAGISLRYLESQRGA